MNTHTYTYIFAKLRNIETSCVCFFFPGKIPSFMGIFFLGGSSSDVMCLYRFCLVFECRNDIFIMKK